MDKTTNITRLEVRQGLLVGPPSDLAVVQIRIWSKATLEATEESTGWLQMTVEQAKKFEQNLRVAIAQTALIPKTPGQTQ